MWNWLRQNPSPNHGLVSQPTTILVRPTNYQPWLATKTNQPPSGQPAPVNQTHSRRLGFSPEPSVLLKRLTHLGRIASMVISSSRARALINRPRSHSSATVRRSSASDRSIASRTISSIVSSSMLICPSRACACLERAGWRSRHKERRRLEIHGRRRFELGTCNPPVTVRRGWAD